MFGLEAVGQLVHVDRLVFEREPQPLDKNIVHEPAVDIHGDAVAGIPEHAGEVEAGELDALVGVEYLRFAIFGQSFAQGRDAEPGIQAVRQPLFEVFSQRYERGSTLLTSNLPFDEWTEVFGSERLTGALLDRLTHHVHILEMNGESYRLKQSEKQHRNKQNKAQKTAEME